VINIAGLRPNSGIVKWQDGELFGIGFNSVYSVDDLMGFLKQQQQQNQQQQGAIGRR
jgi:hypothetical protein